MQEKSLIKQNILIYLDYKGVTKYKYYKETNTTRGILDQNNGITEDNLLKFLKYAQDISLYWLFTGKGEMIYSGDNNNRNVEHGTGTKKDLMYKELVTEKDKEIALLNREIGKLQLEIELIKQHHFTGYNEAAEPSRKYTKKKD